MVTAALASSFRVNASASQLASTNARYANRGVPIDIESDNDNSDDDLARSSDRHNSSRYKLMDERAHLNEAEQVARMIQELQVQRQARVRPQSARNMSSSKPRANKEARPSTPIVTHSRRRPASARSPAAHKHCASSTSVAAPASRSGSQQRNWATASKNATSLHNTEAAAASCSDSSFESRILDELQQLKQAQRRDLEAIEQLQREKERAERRAHALEQHVRSASPPQSAVRTRVVTTRQQSSTRRLIEIDEPSDYVDRSSCTDDDELDFEFSDDLGDESLPPPQYDDDRLDNDVDATSSSLEPSPPTWATRSSSVSHTHVDSPGDYDVLKQRAADEEQRIHDNAAARLARAQRAQPPTLLLERQERARERKQAQLVLLAHERDAELHADKRVKARDVPLSTYVATAQELDAQRQERIRERAQQLLASAELPPRMARVDSATGDSSLIEDPLVFTTTRSSNVMSVKRKKQLAAAADEAARKASRKPKPVPNFDMLHAQWTKATTNRKVMIANGANSAGDTVVSNGDDDKDKRPGSNEPRAFFTARTAERAALQAKKAARRERQREKEAVAQSLHRDAQRKLLERVQRSTGSTRHASPANGEGVAGNVIKSTKSDALRVQKVLERLAQTQKQQQREALDADARQQRMQRATKRVTAQVRASESTRVGDRSDYVSIHDVDQLATQRAQEFKRSLRESIAQNKARILGAVASKPSLMERFATDLKREAHKKQALEAVVKNVFKGNLAVMKGILTDDEHELASDIVAADRLENDRNNDNSNGATSGNYKTSAKEDDDEYSDA